MKLKLNTKPTGAANGAPAATPTSATPSLKVKFKGASASAPSAPADSSSNEPPKQKRKYTKKPKLDDEGNEITSGPKGAKPKKRAREETGEDASPAAKRKPKPTAKSLELAHSDDDDDTMASSATIAVAPRAAPARTASLLKIKMKSGGQNGPQRSGTFNLKLKGVHGKPPPRPPGVGYDSEAEEAEEDPAIESQFILRMQPGPDCDALRKAIEDKTIGLPSAKQGTSVLFRFFDREGRRATVSINGRLYAACMVDLPTVTESMKSWNKKDWVKSADVCQMLLVLGRVQSEDEAKKFPLPREVNTHSHQYAHGLTPPMHYVRKRRFRPRKSYHDIERQEAVVQALFDDDQRAKESGGNTDYQIIDEDMVNSSDESTDEDAEGEDEDEDVAETTEYVIEGETPGGEEVEIDGVDNADLEAALAAGLMEDDEEGVDDLFGGDVGEVETPATSHDVAMHALGDDATPIAETAASTPNAVTSPDDDDEDDDAESPGEEVVDAEETAAQEGREQDMAEIRELEQEIADARKQYEQFNNVLYKQRCKTKIDRLLTDLNLKRAALGIGDEGDQ